MAVWLYNVSFQGGKQHHSPEAAAMWRHGGYGEGSGRLHSNTGSQGSSSSSSNVNQTQKKQSSVVETILSPSPSPLYATTSFGGSKSDGDGVLSKVNPSCSQLALAPPSPRYLPPPSSLSSPAATSAPAVLSSRNRRHVYASISLCLERQKPGIFLCVLICGMLSLSLFISYAVVQQAKSSSRNADGVLLQSRSVAPQQFRFAPPLPPPSPPPPPPPPPPQLPTGSSLDSETTSRRTAAPPGNNYSQEELLNDGGMSEEEDDSDNKDYNNLDDYFNDSQQPDHTRMAEPQSDSTSIDDDDDDDDEIFIAIPNLRTSQFASSFNNSTSKMLRLNSILLNRLLKALTARRDDNPTSDTSNTGSSSNAADLTRIDDFRRAGRGRKSEQLASSVPLELVGDHIVVNGSSVFEVMHRLWSNEEPNANRITPERCVKRLNGSCVKYRLRRQRFVLNIFWTLDQDSIPADTVYYALYRDNRHRDVTQQPTQQPTFVDISRYLTPYQKIGLLRNAIRDSLEEWSSSFDYRVVFQELPYSQLQADSDEFNRVVVIAFHSLQHTDEHTSLHDDFTSDQTIAHASFNVLHLNDAYRYYLVPRPVTRKVPVIFRNSPKERSERDGEYELFMLGGAAFTQHFNATFRQLYPTVRSPRPMKLMTNLAAVLSHEIGHILGLSHFVGRYAATTSGSSDNVVFDERVDGGTSMMASYYNENVTMLTPIDKLAINQLFAPLIEKSRTLEKDLH